MLIPEQFAMRRTGITATDAPKILGYHPQGSIRGVWMDKKGLTEDVQNEAMYWGSEHEETIAKRFQRDHPELAMWDPAKTFRSEAQPWMLATPDRFLSPSSSHPPYPLEIKTANQFMAAEWGDGPDEIPKHYLLQVLWQLAVLDAPVARVAVLIGGNDYRDHYEIHRDAELEEMMIGECGKFWTDCVNGDTEPDFVGSVAETNRLKTMYPESAEDDWIQPDELIEAEWRAYALARQDAERLGQQTLRHENWLRNRIGAKTGIAGLISYRQAREGHRIDWKAVAFDMKATREIIEKFTTTTPGSRRFLPKKLWRDVKAEEIPE